MTTHLFSSLAAAGFLLLAISFSSAQEPVSTGMVESISADKGTVTIRSDQTHGDITLFGLDHANIFTADGKSLTIGDLAQGQMVTIAYAVRDKRWFISKVILSEPRPAMVNRNTTRENVDRIREATEGATRTPSAEGKPDVAPPQSAQPAPVQETPLQPNAVVSVPLRRVGP